MFFILSKIFSFLLNPLSWVFILLGFAYFLKNQKRRKYIFYTAIAVLYVFSNNSLFHLVDLVWSEKAINLPQNKQYEYAIVLGGMANFDDEIQRIRFSASADRLLQTVLLYKTGKAKKIIISGGSGSILYPEQIESEIVRNYLIETGIPAKDILIENKSKNTHENAFYTAKLLQNMNFMDTCILVSSAMHIKRAKACFTKEGIKVKAYPVSQTLNKYRFSPDNLLFPNAEALNGWQQLLHEIAGFIVYWMRGYI